MARRILHQSPGDRITAIMSTRFKHRQVDGDESEMSSALEMAIDSHWYVLLFGLIMRDNQLTETIAQSSYHPAKHKMVRVSHEHIRRLSR